MVWKVTNDIGSKMNHGESKVDYGEIEIEINV